MVCNVISSGLKHMRRPNVTRLRAWQNLCPNVCAKTLVFGVQVLLIGAWLPAAYAQSEPIVPATPAATETEAPQAGAVPEAVAVPKAVEVPVAVTASTAVAAPGADFAAPGNVVATEAKPATKKAWPWRGAISFRNLTSVTAFDKSYQQSYLPSEALGVLMTPRYMLTDKLSIGLWQYATVELTNTADTTYYREPVLSDTMVMLGWSALNTIKTKNDDGSDNKVPHGVALTLSGIAALPTSKASIAKQLYTSLGVGVGARYVWHDLTVGLNTRFQHSFYKNTTMQYAAQPITSCSGEAAACDPSLLSSGVRSPDWRILAIGSVSYQITEKLGVSVSGGEIMDWLPALTPANNPAIGAHNSLVPTGDDTRFRALMYTGAGVDYAIVSWLSAGIGLETYNSQLTLNSTYEAPMVNRYTTAYLELSLALDGLPH